ncbi:MAG: type I methionyl aminopeptidase [Solirubrobacterales bacterium]|nr:type I methionyl aminopeptidase [Solirubrobacterales bacterium]OJU93875.1 MAG: type I methionyl aminopeptidase [Solirubrobacterales bacterium 67-14]
MIIRKTDDQIEKMAAAGAVHARCMKMLTSKVRPGVTTADLDEAAEKFIRSQGGVPTFKGFRGFPGSICASPNSMVVHGIPGPYTLEKGDIISIDIGVTLDGWVADGASTIPVGPIDETTQKLLTVTKESLDLAAAQMVPGNRVGDIGHAVQSHVEANGFSIIRTLVGHGVGQDMHEEPQIPNYGTAGRGPEIEEGMVFAIEPMVNVGGPHVYMDDDGWSVYSEDGSMAAHFEYTVAATADGPRILTPWDRD